MFDVLNDLKGHIKLDDICIDNNVFRLHYKVHTAYLRSPIAPCALCAGHLRDLADGERPGDRQDLHRRPDRLHRGGDSPGRDGHLLLDTLHLQVRHFLQDPDFTALLS